MGNTTGNITMRQITHAFIWSPRALIGEELTLQNNILLEVKNNRITKIRQISPEELSPSDTNTPHLYILEDDITLIPCLKDAHVHMALDGGNFDISPAKGEKGAECANNKQEEPNNNEEGKHHKDAKKENAHRNKASEEALIEENQNGLGYERSKDSKQREKEFFRKNLQDLELFCKQGIGAVRDGGDLQSLNLRLKNFLEAENLENSDETAARENFGSTEKNGEEYFTPGIVATGQALRRKGKYGSFLGNGYSTPRELKAELARLLLAGVDQVKVIVSGVVSFNKYGRVGSPAMSTEELEHVVSRCHSRGLKVMAHANSQAAIERAIKAGVDSIEHGYFITPGLLEAMSARQIAWVPTLIPVAAQLREPRVSSLNLQQKNNIDRICREHMDKIAFAAEIGVPLGIGTDSGAPGVKHGSSLFEEMMLYRFAGIAPREILRAATITNAKIMGVQDSMGCLQEGNKPCLIGVRGNPIDDFSALRRLEWFFRAEDD